MSKEYYQSLMIPPKLIIFLSIASSFFINWASWGFPQKISCSFYGNGDSFLFMIFH